MSKRKEVNINSLRILGRDYNINYVPPSDFQQMEMGICDNKSQTISISLEQTPIEATDTFIHEVFHAIDYLVGLDLSEHQVRHLASTFTGILQDNPEWAKWIIQNKSVERELYEQAVKSVTRSTSHRISRTDTPKGRSREGQRCHPKRG